MMVSLWIGYVADGLMILNVVGFIYKKLWAWLFNGLASAMFIIYGWMIGSMPVIIAEIIVLVLVVFGIKKWRKDKIEES